LDGLKAELEQVGGIPISSQILMTSFGLQLKAEMMNDVNKAVGKVKIKFYASFFFGLIIFLLINFDLII